MRNTLIVAAVWMWAGSATAQTEAAVPPAAGVEPQAVNPGDTAEATDVERVSGLAEEAPGASPEAASAAPVQAEAASAAPVQAEAAPAVPVQPEAAPAAAAQPESATPAIALRTADSGARGIGLGDVTAALAASVRASYQGASAFELDAAGTRGAIAPLMTRVRVTPEIRWGGLGFVGEADVATGAIIGAPGAATVGTRVPYPELSALELRKLYLEYKWRSGVFRAGQMTSNWGLGLLANDGNSDPKAGEFGQQQFGNLTYRALLGVRPAYNAGGRFRAFETVVAADLIVRDTFGEFALGDRAFQGVVALRFAKDNENHFGVYGVYRTQRNINVTDGGKATDAFVADFAGKWQLINRRNRELQVGWEVVAINGTTTQARNENAERLLVSSLGAAFKTKYRLRNVSLYFDGGFASGDQNPGDDRIENFRFDRDYKVGLVLFDQVLGYQSARGSVRASDPTLVGVAPEGADLLGTAGGLTGAWYLYPRLKVGVRDWIDVYGGPLFAFSTAKLADPFNSRVGGGTAVNALGGRPGDYLGTELDLGVQARFSPVPEVQMSATGETGLFLAGDAFRLPTGGVMGPIVFGRIRLSVQM